MRSWHAGREVNGGGDDRGSGGRWRRAGKVEAVLKLMIYLPPGLLDLVQEVLKGVVLLALGEDPLDHARQVVVRAEEVAQGLELGVLGVEAKLAEGLGIERGQQQVADGAQVNVLILLVCVW